MSSSVRMPPEKLQLLIAPYVTARKYPEPRPMREDDANRLSPCAKDNLRILSQLIGEEPAAKGELETPVAGSPWEALRANMRDVLEKILIENPGLIEVETIQVHAIDKGAIPDPDEEESAMRYFRLPNWDFAHWNCGTPVAGRTVSRTVRTGGMQGAASTGEVRNVTVLYCPTCELPPSPHGHPIYE